MIELDLGTKVVLFGTGSGAEHFVTLWKDKLEIVAVADAQPKATEFLGIELVHESQINELGFDFVVIASWAFQDICARLVTQQLPKRKMLWYQNHKSKLLSIGQIQRQQYTCVKAPENTLYAFYDLNCSRTTFDVMGFLALADIEREQRGLDWLHLIIANATDNEFNQQMHGIINNEEHEWRKQHILAQTARLIPALSGTTLTSHRAELEYYGHQKHVFPNEYQPHKPIAAFEFDVLFEQLKNNVSIQRLAASESARQLVQKKLAFMNPEGKPLVVITLRESSIQPARNSLIDDWIRFCSYLDNKGYFTIVIPDSESTSSRNWQQFAAEPFYEANFDVEIRMALYEFAFVNLGVNNGPMYLCALNKHCNYIIFKQIVDDYPHSSKASFEKRNFTIGGDFPGAIEGQYLEWCDDYFENLVAAFEEKEMQIRKSSQMKLLG